MEKSAGATSSQNLIKIDPELKLKMRDTLGQLSSYLLNKKPDDPVKFIYPNSNLGTLHGLVLGRPKRHRSTTSNASRATRT
jgi:hypothetical protein